MPYGRANLWTEIGRGLTGLGQEHYARKRERMLDEERREERDFGRALTAFELGGGVGDVPTMTTRRPVSMTPDAPREIGGDLFQVAPPPDLAAAEGMLEVPEFGGMSSPTVERQVPHPGYTDLGDIYAATPGYEERRERERFFAEVPQAIDQLSDPERRSEGVATLLGFGVSDPMALAPSDEPEEMTERERVEFFLGKGLVPPGSSLVRKPAGTDTGQAMEFSDALDYLTDLYTIPHPQYEDEEVLAIPRDQIRRLARELSETGDAALPEPPGPPGSQVLGPPEVPPPTEDEGPGWWGRFFGGRDRQTASPPPQPDFDVPPPEGERPAPEIEREPEPEPDTVTDERPDTATTQEQEDEELRRLMQGMSREEKSAFLVRIGATDEEIARILGSEYRARTPR